MENKGTNIPVEYSSDNKMHEMSEDCWCEPEIEEIYDESGVLINRLVIHREVH